MQSLRYFGRSLVALRPLKSSSRNIIACCALCSQGKMEHLEKNEYFDKYKDKLKRLQETSPDDFHSKIESMIEAKKPKPKPQPRSEPAASPNQSLERQAPAPAKSERSAKGKDLNSVMKLELIQDKSAAEITQIWKEYHGKKDGIFAVIESKEYNEIHSKTKEYPLFLFPVPRSQGYEFILAQFSGHQCHFTPLIAYQNYQENAPPCLTMTHYPELSEEKGIVLMNGEYDDKVISTETATILAHQLQMYYGHQGASRFHLVQKFSKEPNAFKHADLITEFENLTAGQFMKKS